MVPKVTEAFEHNEPFWVVDPDLKTYSMPHNEENTSFEVSTNSDGLRSSIEVTDSQKDPAHYDTWLFYDIWLGSCRFRDLSR